MTSSSQTGHRVRLRLLISLGVGVLVTVVALVTAWREYGAETESLPTLVQFLSTEADAKGLIVGCLACGVLAALATLITLRGPDLGRGRILSLVLKLTLVTCISLVLVFGFILLEISSGR